MSHTDSVRKLIRHFEYVLSPFDSSDLRLGLPDATQETRPHNILVVLTFPLSQWNFPSMRFHLKWNAKNVRIINFRKKARSRQEGKVLLLACKGWQSKAKHTTRREDEVKLSLPSLHYVELYLRRKISAPA